MRNCILVAFIKIGFIVLLAQGVSAGAAEVRVIASPSLSAVMEAIGPRFERATAHKIAISYGLIASMKRHIETGEPFDLAIIPAALMDNVGKQGRFAADTIAEIARISLGVAARAGATKPDIGSVEAFKRTLLDTQSVTYIPDEPTGMHVTKIFERLDIAAQMQAKIRPQQHLHGVMRTIASGEADLGFAVISNIVSEPGVELVGRVPSELQYQIVLKAGVASAAREADAARALIKYLMAPEAVAIIRAKGLDPAVH